MFFVHMKKSERTEYIFKYVQSGSANNNSKSQRTAIEAG